MRRTATSVQGPDNRNIEARAAEDIVVSVIHYSNKETDIRMEACEWIIRIDGGAVNEADLAALRAWLARSPGHKAAFEAAAANFMDVNDILSTVGTAVHDMEQGGARPSRGGRLFNEWSWGRRAAMAAAAALVLVVSASLFFEGRDSAQQGNIQPIAYSTPVGQKKTITLEDGSSVIINTGSEITAEFSDHVRRIQLVRGEALFDVASDVNRPFRVYTNNVVVSALGTVFSVRVSEKEVEVFVEEGRVELTANVTAEPQEGGAPALQQVSSILSAGAVAQYNAEIQQTSEMNDPAFIARRLAWRQGMLVFDNEPLSFVVEEFNRYTTSEIRISDNDVADINIGGAFPLGETAALLDALEQGFGITVEQVGEDVYRLQ